MPQTETNKYPAPDMSLLKEMSEGNHEFFMEIVELFLENAPGMLKSITNSAKAGDFDALKFAAHKILSDLFVVGLNYAIPVVKEIERSATMGSINEELISQAEEMILYGIEDLKKIS